MCVERCQDAEKRFVSGSAAAHSTLRDTALICTRAGAVAVVGAHLLRRLVERERSEEVAYSAFWEGSNVFFQ